MTECYCDYAPATVYRKAMHKARKPHVCYECHRTIAPGEKYERVFAIWEGDPNSVATCSHCLALREFVVAHVPCSCWSHGNMIDDVTGDAQEWAHEAPGLLFGTYRRKILIARARHG